MKSFALFTTNRTAGPLFRLRYHNDHKQLMGLFNFHGRLLGCWHEEHTVYQSIEKEVVLDRTNTDAIRYKEYTPN